MYDVTKKEVFDRVLECLEIADKEFPGVIFMPPEKISITNGRDTIGTIRHKTVGKIINWKLTLSHEALKENRTHMWKITIPHEVAHYVTYVVFGPRVKPHGIEWKYVMRHVFNLPPDVHHRLNLDPVGEFETYYCGCDTHKISGVRLKRVKAGTRYKCGKCRKILKRY